jgi:NADPH:quinone reductase-like Zn-dependent oxidoreductase
MPSMLAVEAHERGGAESLHVERVDRPEPSRGEALVEVHAAGITPTELTWDTTWTTEDGRSRLPTIPSHEVSGVVVAAREGSASLVGEDVYGLIDFFHSGAAAEYVAVPTEDLARKPKSVDHVHAAALPLSALTAWQGLFKHAGLQEHQRLLVQGAAGGVGSYAVQLGRHAGAAVIGVASALDEQLVKELGAHGVIDYKTRRFEDAVTEVDVVFDTVGGDVQRRSWKVLKPGGTLVSIVAQPSAELAEEHHAHGVMFIVEPNRDDLTSIANLADNGELTPIVSAVFPLAEGPTAYVTGLHDHVPGKIVLDVRAGGRPTDLQTAP